MLERVMGGDGRKKVVVGGADGKRQRDASVRSGRQGPALSDRAARDQGQIKRRRPKGACPKQLRTR